MNCAICYGRDVGVVLDLGEMALAGAFLKPEDFAEERVYPLRLGFCGTCCALQVMDRVEPDEMFGDYFYRSSTSKAARTHFARYAEEIVQRFAPKTVVEVGCNDGAMLRPLVTKVPRVIGVDPSNTPVYLPGVEVWRSYFTERVGRSIGHVDVIVANNVFGHVENVHEFLRAVRASLSPDGVFVFECHYLGAVLDGQYDAIYHEHVFYHSLMSAQRLLRLWGLEVFDVKPINRHGGSMRYYACRNGAKEICSSVASLLKQESERGFDREDTYALLAVRMLDHRRALCGLYSRLRNEHQTISAYGAAGRANTLLQWCGIDGLDYVVDDCQAKHGYYTPGTHIEIVPPARLQEDPTDCLLVTAWTCFDEIRARCDGYLGNVILPLPKVSMHRFFAQGGQRMVL